MAMEAHEIESLIKEAFLMPLFRSKIYAVMAIIMVVL